MLSLVFYISEASIANACPLSWHWETIIPLKTAGKELITSRGDKQISSAIILHKKVVRVHLSLNLLRGIWQLEAHFRDRSVMISWQMRTNRIFWFLISTAMRQIIANLNEKQLSQSCHRLITCRFPIINWYQITESWGITLSLYFQYKLLACYSI